MSENFVTLQGDYIEPDMSVLIKSYLKPGMIYVNLEFKSITSIKDITSYFSKFGKTSVIWNQSANGVKLFVCGESIALIIRWSKARLNSIIIQGIGMPEIVDAVGTWINEQLDKSSTGLPITIFEKYIVERTQEISATVHQKTTADFTDILPFLYQGLDVDKFVDSYIKSKESIVFLVGAPGTGKTSLVKKIIHDISVSLDYPSHGYYIKDPLVLKDDGFWADITWKEPNFLILDDLDSELSPREWKTPEELKGSIVNKLLSFSNGVFPPHSKIIITSNLEAESIDKALLRPGRCFDILRLKPLSREFAESVWINKLNQSADTFNKYFDGKQEITQAFLMSEYNKVIKKAADYLTDRSISIRKDYTDYSKPTMRMGR